MFDPKTVSLGIAPIGWCNDDMPELGAENTFQQTVSEMALAGFTGCEIGNKYPTDPAELKKALDLRGMRIASRWYSSFILTRSMEEEEKDFIANLDFLEAVGANHINVSEQSYSIQGKVDVPILTGGHKHVMNDEEWDRFCKGLNRLGQIASERGFKLCFHHHMGTVVQTSEETDRMMSNTDPRYVFLCYDTGHFTFAGEDPLAMLKKYVDRVGHVHLKDMRLPVVEEARKNNWSFLQSVRNGAFTVPGDGNVDFDPVFKVLSDADYQGWLLVEAEQDPAKANPLEYAIKGRTYIRERWEDPGPPHRVSIPLFDIKQEMFPMTYFNKNKELKRGYNAYIDESTNYMGTLMNVGLLVMEDGDTYTYESADREVAILLFEGKVTYEYAGKTVEADRPNCFHHEAYCLLAPKGTKITLTAHSHSELYMQDTLNEKDYEPVMYTPETVQTQHAGSKGELMGAMEREIKTFFDYDNAPFSNMVLGEVLNRPGKWSSYPPHHHPQPEVYFYRFDYPHGFGAGFANGDVYKTEQNGCAVINHGFHSQVVAPGYAMCYAWGIRHLEGDPWLKTRIDDKEHEWLWKPDANDHIYPNH